MVATLAAPLQCDQVDALHVALWVVDALLAVLPQQVFMAHHLLHAPTQAAVAQVVTQVAAAAPVATQVAAAAAVASQAAVAVVASQAAVTVEAVASQVAAVAEAAVAMADVVNVNEQEIFTSYIRTRN